MSRDRSLSSLEINEYFKNNKYYGGCLSKDELKNKKPDNKFWIVNLMDSDKGGGSHWVLVFDCIIPDANRDMCMYFDPYGIHPPPVIVNFMKRSKKGKIYTDDQYQDMDSTQCGYYCIYVVEQLFKSIPYSTIFDKELDDKTIARNEGVILKMKL